MKKKKKMLRMINIKSILSIYLSVCLSGVMLAQGDIALDVYVKNILEHHPYIKIANNKLLKSEYKLKAARGAFDPKISGSWQLKEFDDKSYYNLQNVKLKAPNRTGVTPIVKFQNNTGYYLNPQNGNPSGGLLGAGIEIPILQGLVIDLDRKNVNISKLENEKQTFKNDSTINTIMALALKDYINWAKAYYMYESINNIFETRKERFENTLNMYEGGNISPMDTLDAYAQLNKTERDLLGTQATLTKYYYKVLNNIWDPILTNIDTIIPVSFNDIENYVFPKSLNLAIENHNLISSLVKSKEQLEIEVKYRREQFKPKLNLELLPIASFTNPMDGQKGFSSNNFASNLTFELPLYYRKQSNYYRVYKLEIENTEAKIEFQKKKILNSYRASIVNVTLLKSQLNISTRNMEYLNTLKTLEEEKYNIGESTLIKLNLRENKFIDEQIKLYSTSAKYINELIDLNIILQTLN
jgi:outer membrane protein TolC